MFAACQESLEDRCAREAKEYTKKNCPGRIDEHTTIDSLVFERATRTMHYYYTLKGNADDMEKINNSDPSGLLLGQIRNSTSIKTYKDAGYNFAYTYHSEKDKGKILFQKTFTPKEYR